jgi:YVTN family beta-propeller protein
VVELPSGTVTFLFTDVEGSTQLLKQLRERYAESLEIHQRLLREAFERHGGRELDTQGDAFFYVFPRARDAVLAAVEAQRALRDYSEWPEGAEFKVRMGIHTGQAEVSDGRYTGLAVHRAARICAAAHGGQVLLSQATETLLADEEEDLHVTFRALGQHRLKDLDRPVSLYQAGAADLPGKFPPPREQAPRAASWVRRPMVLVPAALGVAAIAAIAIILLTGGGKGGLAGVDANNVGVIDPKSNAIVAAVPTGRRPGPIAAGPGAVWIGNLDDRLLTRIDPKSRTQAGTISLENRTPTGIAVSPAAVWVVHGLLGSVSQVDPQYNRVVRTIPVADRSDAGSAAVGGGALWAVFGNATLTRLTLEGRVTGTGFAGGGPSGIVYAEGAVWVANGGESTVYRFNPATFETAPVAKPTVGRQPSAIAYGEGSIWVTNSGDGTVSRLDPSSNSARTIPVGRRPSAVAVGLGAVWVANADDGTVSRIDPRSNTVVKTIHIGNRPAGLAVGDGFVWVTVQSP